MIGAAIMIHSIKPIRYIGPVFLPPLLKGTWNLGRSNDWRTERLRKFMDSHDGKLGRNVKTVVRDLKLDISGIHAGRLFKRDLGIGIREYAKRTRLVTAAVLLRVSPDSIKQIAARLGYRSVQDFTRVFRAMFNQSPTEFREAQRRSAQKLLEAKAS